MKLHIITRILKLLLETLYFDQIISHGNRRKISLKKFQNIWYLILGK